MPVIEFIPQGYCRTCHLSTRMDISRCLHCNQLLKAPEVKAVRTRTAKARTSAGRTRFRLKLSAAKRRHSTSTPLRKVKARHR